MQKPRKALSLLLAILMLLSLSLGTMVWAEGADEDSDPVQEDTAEQPAEETGGCTAYSQRYDRIQFHPDHPGTYIFISGSTATAKFSTVEDCVEVNFSVYTYENTPKPYEDQLHFASSSMKYDTAGSYELTINLPPCGKMQLDLYAGPMQITLNPGYGHDHLTLRNFALHTLSECVPTPSPTPTESAPPSEDPSPTPTESAPPSEDPSPTPTESAPPSEDPSPTPTESAPPSEDPSPTPTESAPPSEDPSPTPTESAPPSEAPSPTPTESAPPSEDPSPTPTESAPPSEAPSPTPTESAPPSEAPSPSPTPEVIIIEDEDVPTGGGPDEEVSVPLETLPKTGESSPTPYYLLGTFFTISGLLALKRRNRSNS
ncbi:LPXTG cell wall anchor domain-containing protein [Paenibacillus chungangensis]|uniref:LPXTG cell wall anchor domain-containing protein n=1 Tax=Paenibacillus chungangensis TaxID=696535 RepID=A0ABW3HKD2_9BACL